MIIVVLVVAVLVVAYIVYPLNRTKAMTGRIGLDDFDEDSTLVNDPTFWNEAGLFPDTATIEADGIASLASLYLTPPVDSSDTTLPGPAGTMVLLHHEQDDRDSLLELARKFVDVGYAVIVYDQRASGRSTGLYHGEGQYEASDLIAVIAWYDLRQLLPSPVTVVGFGVGADAALLARAEDDRISNVVAVEPYLSTKRMQDVYRQQYDAYWFPLYRTIMWFWYDIRSSYAASYREVEDVHGVDCPTLLMIDPERQDDEAVVRLRELSSAQVLTVRSPVTDVTELFIMTVQLLNQC